MEAITRQAQHLKKTCSKRTVEWTELSLAITELADAVETLAVHDHDVAVSDHLLPLAHDLGELLRNIRSKLVCDVCEQLGRIVKTTRLAFTPLASALLDALASTAKASSVAIRNPGFQLFSDLSQYTRYDLQTVQKVYSSSPQERVKSLVLEQLQIVLTYWPKDAIAPFYDDMVEIMRRGMRDPSTHVRTACRQTFCSFSDLWQERVDELVSLPSQPARDLLIKEKPFATITQAIRRKFSIEPPTANRVGSVRKGSTAARRLGSSAAGEDAICVKVKESPRRPLERKVEAEPPTRMPSPGRGPPRSASPSSAARSTASSVRAASPSATSTVRTAPPSGATVRRASPSRATKDGYSAGPVTSRATLPGRQPSPAILTNGHVSASRPVSARSSEFDHYPRSSIPEQNAGNAIAHGEPQTQQPTRSAPSQPQKRVSIQEPPVVSDPVYKLNEPLLQTRPTPHQFSSREDWNSNFLVREDICDGNSPSPLSDTSSPPRTSRFASAGHQSVSRTQAEVFVANDRAQQVDKVNTPEEHRHPFAEYSTLPLRPGKTPSDGHPDKEQQLWAGTTVDSYLDQPTSSSAPAPEPRAPANVTQRSRRPHVDDLVHSDRQSNELPGEQPTPNGASHVTVGYVPPVGKLSAVDRHCVTRSVRDDEPPSVSIDSAFQPRHMTTVESKLTKIASGVDTAHDDCFDDEISGKENVHDDNVRQQVTSANSGPTIPDALANLQSLRAGIQALRETHLAAMPIHRLKPLPTIDEDRDAHKMLISQPPDRHSTYRNHQGVAMKERQHQRAEISNVPMQSNRQDRDVDASRDLHAPKQNVIPPTKAIRPFPQVRADPPMPLASRPERRTHQPPGHAEPAHTSDCVRKPTAFNFASAAPRAQQAQRTHTYHGPPPNNQQVDRTHSRQHQAAAFADETAPRNRQHPIFPPPKYPQPPQKPFSLNAGLPSASTVRSTPETIRQSTQREPSATESSANRRRTLLNPKPDKIQVGVANKMIYSFCLVLGTLFGVSGLIQATTKVRDAYEYHSALLHRMNQFESSIVESYELVRKMDEKYATWSDYVRELTEEDESNALAQLESIQVEVDKWQTEMKHDLLQFKRSLSGDIIDAALAHLREPPNATIEASTTTEIPMS